MSQKKILLYSADGEKEEWFMEDQAPADWVRHKPEPKEDEVDEAKLDELQNKPGNSESHRGNGIKRRSKNVI